MSLESDLYTVLNAQCARVFPDVAPFDTECPYITWQQIGGEALAYVEDTVPNERNAYVQINVWDTTRIGATALALQIEAALIQSTAFQARPQSALQAAHDDDTDRRGCLQDFTIWAAR